MSVTEARPINERIAATLYERLRYLVTSFEAATVSPEVVRPKRLEEYTPKHLQIVLRQGDEEEVPNLSLPGNPPAVAWLQPWSIVCHIMPHEDDPTSFDEYSNTAKADIKRAVTKESAQWYTFGGLALNAEFGAAVGLEASGGIDGFELPLNILYRVSETDPYQQRG